MKDNYLLGFRNCRATWVIVEGTTLSGCPIYSTAIQQDDYPPFAGWSDGAAVATATTAL